MDALDQLQVWFTTQLPNIVQALLILLVGWIIALILSAVVRSVLRRLRTDERLNRQVEPRQLNVSDLVARGVFWLVLLFAIVGALQALQLGGIAVPLGGLLDQFIGFIPNLIGAAILAAVAWIVATIVRRLIEGALNATDWDERLREGARMDRSVPLGPTLGTFAYWLIWLLFLPGILDALELGGLLAPVEEMVSNVVAFIPNLLSAAIIMIVGYFVARIVRDIVTNLLASTGVDDLARRYGFDGETSPPPTLRVAREGTATTVTPARGPAATTAATPAREPLTLSRLIGTLVFALILIPVAITALDVLNLEALSQPAIAMLNRVLAAIPNIFAAAILLAIAYFVARLVAQIVSDVLAGVGFDRFLARIGLREAVPGAQQPSDTVGTLVLIGIMLLAVAEAASLLGFAALASLVASFLVFFGNVLLGLVVLGLGLYLARLAYQTVRTSGVQNADLLAMIARYSIILLSIFMALQQMGIAVGIVTLAFGLLLGALAVAAAIALGLGARPIAERELDRLVSDLKDRPTPPPTVSDLADPDMGVDIYTTPPT